MTTNNRFNRIAFFTVLIVVLASMVPKMLMFTNNVVEPFTNSVVALSIETKVQGHVPLSPYTISGYWQQHANFLSLRTGIVSFLTILSSVTGLPPYLVSTLPLDGILTVIVGYLFGRAFGSRFLGLAFALSFGFSWYTTLTSTNISYQSYGALLQLYIFFILVRSCVGKTGGSKADILMVSILFIAIYESYYSVEFTTLALFIAILFFSLVHRVLKYRVTTLRIVPFLTLFMAIIFLALDTVEYGYLSSQSVSLFMSSISNYVSYVLSIVYGESQAIQQYRPYTSPFSKYVDLASNIMTWAIIGLSLLLYLNTLIRSRKRRMLTQRNVTVHIVLFSFIFVFFARLSIYGLLGKIAIGWIYISLLPIVLGLFWIAPRARFRQIRYVLPLILVFLTIFRFGIIWTDTTLSFIGANYPPQIAPGATWIAQNLNSSSVVSTNQVSARIFSTIAAYGKANFISVNQFGSDIRYLTGNSSQIQQMLRSHGYSYVFLLKLFDKDPLFGGFWGPYIPPIGNEVENLSDQPGFSRVYDDGMALTYKCNPN